MAILLLNGLNSQIRMKVSTENTPDLSIYKHSLLSISLVRYQSHSQSLIFILEMPEIFQKVPNWTILDKYQILVTKRSNF